MKSKLIKTGAAILFGLAGAGTALAQTSTSPGPSKGAGPAQQMTQAQCQSLWNQADKGQSGSLTQTQAQPFTSSFSAVDANADGKLSRTEFLQGCEGGMIHSSASTGTSSGTSGTGTGPGSGSREQPPKN